ncbi:MAG: O-antigen ligase family protein [Chloroflexi bacterium]|nr:O-antigen ligase family protein [Chloroflexota bacterium]
MSLGLPAGLLRSEALGRISWTVLFLLIAILLGIAIGWGAVSYSPFTLLFLLVGLVGSVAVAFSPGLAVIGLMAIIWLLPFGTLPFRVGFRFSFLDLATGALLFLFAWQVCTHRLRLPSRVSVVAVALYVLLLLVAAGNGLRFGMSEDAITHSIKLASSAFIFVMLVTWLQTEQAARRAATWFLVFAAGQALIGVVLYLIPPAYSIKILSQLGRIGYPVGGGVLRYIADTPLLRATGTSIDPNMLGGALVFAIAFGVALWASHPRRWWLLGLLGLLLLCLLLTRSRAALLGSGAAIVVLTTLRYRWLFWLYPLGGITIAALPQTRAMLLHLLSGLRAQDRAAAMRLDEYSKSFNLIQDHPLLGVGFGPPPTIDTFVGVSSIYLQLAELGGFVTLAAFSLAVGAALWSMLQGWRRGLTPDSEWVALGALAGLLGALVTGLFDQHYVVYPHMATLFWLVAGLGVAAAWVGRDSKHSTEDTL